MRRSISQILESGPVAISAPCRVDLGGTLDISTFYLPMRHLNPCTFNMAINLRTQVRIRPYNGGQIRVTSRGFEPAEFPAAEAPFDHPLGLIFAIAAYFNVHGIQIEIDSASPPRSGLGGSSAAAVALVTALHWLRQQADRTLSPSGETIALTAQAIEAGVAGVPCGYQDQLAAVYGGVHAWRWPGNPDQGIFEKHQIIPKDAIDRLNSCFLLAYCGIPHESKDINGIWVRQFLAGKFRKQWEQIIDCVHRFVNAMEKWDIRNAIKAMNDEVIIRQEMTPQVLDSMGEQLVALATEEECGARFTGAGGGGCIWAFGEPEHIDRLRPKWQNALSSHPEASLLDAGIDPDGVMLE